MSNTITAFFKGRVGVAEAVYQNDYGLVMNLDGLDLPAHFDCYFSTLEQDEAIPGIGADNQVVIPNDCLSRAGNVTLHIPLHTGQNDSEVEYIVYFKVIGRARPIDDGTPVQMTAIEQALALLQNPIGNIEQIVNEALAFTGDTFAEMQEQLDADQAAFEAGINSRQSQVESRQTQVESDFTNLNAQFQTAIGAVTVDDELLNIRVGADNFTYATAGEAVRKQASKINDIRLGYKTLTSQDYVAGSYNDDGSAGSTWHVIKAAPIIVNAGDSLRYNTNNFYVRWILLDSTGTKVEQHPASANFWDKSSINTTFKHSGLLYISVRNGWNAGNSSEIVPSDIDFDITVGYHTIDGISMRDVVSTAKDEYKEFSYADFVNGDWQDGVIRTGTTRICTNNLYTVKTGDKLVYNTGSLQIAFGLYPDGNPLAAGEYFTWHTVNEETTYTFGYDGDVFIQFKKSDGSAVSPSEYDANCKLYYGIKHNISDNKDSIENAVDTVVSATWEQGGLNNGNETVDNARIRTGYITMPDMVSLCSRYNYSTLLFWYDKNFNCIDNTPWTAGRVNKDRPTNAVYMRIVLAKGLGSSSAISISDASNLKILGSYYSVGKRTRDLELETEMLISDDTAVKTALGMDSKTFNWEQGGLNPNGETSDTTRIRMSSSEVMPDFVTVVSKAGYKALIYTYDASMNYIIAGEWTFGSFTTERGTAKYFRVVFAKSNNAVITPSESNNVTITYGYKDLASEVIDLSQKVNKTFGANYYGLPMSPKQGYNAFQILRISYSGGTLNSIAVYDNYIVAYINGLNLLRIYEKSTKTLLHEITIDLGHANCMSLGNKFDESDLLPLLYVEVEDLAGTYNVVRVTSNGTASIVKTYTFPPETFGYSPQVTWNFADGVCYSLGYAVDSVPDSKNSVFVRANLNDEVLNQDGSYTPAVLFTCPSQKMAYMQDSQYFNGMIYLAQSSATSGSAISYVLMVDTSGGNIVTKIPAPFTGEIEGMAVYEEDGEVKMCTTNYYTFYEMTFA